MMNSLKEEKVAHIFLSLLSLFSVVKSVVDKNPPAVFIDKDKPLYTLDRPIYIPFLNATNTIVSEFRFCVRKEPYRQIFGSFARNEEDHAIPVEWSSYLGVQFHIFPVPIYELVVRGAFLEILIPFIFIGIYVAIAILAIIPWMALGALVWAILFNIRVFGHKKIRMCIRSILIRVEKYRRWKYERSFPAQHLRKFRERDRYQMPKMFQNSDYSSDDEPVELTREQIPRKKTTMWTNEEIAFVGFDPDNISLDTIYGDLLNNDKDLDPDVRKYKDLRDRPQRMDNRPSENSEELLREYKDMVADAFLEPTSTKPLQKTKKGGFGKSKHPVSGDEQQQHQEEPRESKADIKIPPKPIKPKPKPRPKPRIKMIAKTTTEKVNVIARRKSTMEAQHREKEEEVKPEPEEPHETTRESMENLEPRKGMTREEFLKKHLRINKTYHSRNPYVNTPVKEIKHVTAVKPTTNPNQKVKNTSSAVSHNNNPNPNSRMRARPSRSQSVVNPPDPPTNH